MKAEDYTPGPRIDTPELLRDVLAYEDAVFIDATFYDSGVLAVVDSHPWRARVVKTFTVRRAYLKCPQTAKEMRAHTAAHIAHKEDTP
jgi:hypothetical protein